MGPIEFTGSGPFPPSRLPCGRKFMAAICLLKREGRQRFVLLLPPGKGYPMDLDPLGVKIVRFFTGVPRASVLEASRVPRVARATVQSSG